MSSRAFRSLALRHVLRRLVRPHAPRLWLGAALGGGAFALATLPVAIVPAVFVGLLGYAWLLSRAARPSQAFALGWLWGTVAGAIGMRFVPAVIVRFTALGWPAAALAHVGLAAAQGIPWGLGAALAVAVRGRTRAPLELATALATMLATSLPGVIVWTPAGLVSPWPLLVQTADTLGERGLSALFAALMAALLRGLDAAVAGDPARRRVARQTFAAVAISVALIVVHGVVSVTRWSARGQETARIALVTTGVDPTLRWEPVNWPRLLAELRRETAIAETAGVDLTIWPEAAYPYAMRHDTRAMPRGQREIIGGAIAGPVLFGFLAAVTIEHPTAPGAPHDLYNSVTVVRPDRSLSTIYDKVELLAFGESIPFGEQIHWLRRTFQRGGGLRPGSAPRRIDVERAAGPALHLGVLNCYEDTLTSYGRRVAKSLAPNLLVNVTNDAWFAGTLAPELHLRLSALRAVELRRDLVRSVNLGPSAWIDAAGQVRAVKRTTAPDFLIVTPTLRDTPPTLYASAGDLPTWLLLLTVACGFHLRKPRCPKPR